MSAVKVYLPPSQVEIKKCNVMRCDAMFSAGYVCCMHSTWEVPAGTRNTSHHIRILFYDFNR